MYLLLHCEEAMVSPPTTTSGKGDPLAKMVVPPVAAWACSAEHSDRDVGLERGKMMGWGSFSFMAVRTSSVKSPPQADSPIRMFGLTVLTVSSREIPSRALSPAAKLERSKNCSSISFRLVRLLVIRPSWSTMKNLVLAVCRDRPCLLWRAFLMVRR